MIIRPAALRARIENRIGWHTFRHTFSTLLIANGEDIKVVQELMRHGTATTTAESLARFDESRFVLGINQIQECQNDFLSRREFFPPRAYSSFGFLLSSNRVETPLEKKLHKVRELLFSHEKLRTAGELIDHELFGLLTITSLKDICELHPPLRSCRVADACNRVLLRNVWLQ
jgi:integrase-like protein